MVTICSIISCQRDQEESTTPADPFVGNWKLKAVTMNGQTQDVSNVACWKETTLNADATNATFKLVVSNSNTGACQTSQETYQWTKNNGAYYYTENGQQQTLPIQFHDNNSTLQMNLDVQGTTVIFSFKK